MHNRSVLHRVFLGREVTAAFGILASLYLIRLVSFQPLQIPAYLIIVTYDLIEVILPFVPPYYPITFPLFLYSLALIGGAVARRLQTDAQTGTIPRAAGGVSLIVGSIALLFATVVGGPLISPTDNPTPLAITAATGIVLLITAWWLLRPPTRRSSAAT